MIARPLTILRLLFSSRLEPGDVIALDSPEAPSGRIPYTVTSSTGGEKARGWTPTNEDLNDPEFLAGYFSTAFLGAPPSKPPSCRGEIPHSARKLLASLRLNGTVGWPIPPEWRDDLDLLLELGLATRDEGGGYAAELEFEPERPALGFAPTSEPPPDRADTGYAVRLARLLDQPERLFDPESFNHGDTMTLTDPGVVRWKDAKRWVRAGAVLKLLTEKGWVVGVTVNGERLEGSAPAHGSVKGDGQWR